MGIGKVMMLFALFAISSSIIAQNHDSLYVELIGGQPVIADTAYANDAARTLSTNIFKDNGTLTGNRTLGLGAFDLTFEEGELIFNYDRSEVYSPTSLNSAIATIRNYNTSTAYTPSLIKFQSRGSTTTTTMWEIGNTGQNASYSESDFVIKNRIGSSSYAERMKIEGSGNVLMGLNGGNIGMGTSSPGSKLTVASGDIYISTISKGVILKSPDGTCWRWTPANTTGVVTATSITCP